MNRAFLVAMSVSVFTFSNAVHSNQTLVGEMLSGTNFVEVGEVGVIGRWLDPVGPALVAIQMNEQSEYFFHRRNADGSEGVYRLRKDSENIFYRDDRLGHKYKIEYEGLALLDNQGFIRIAVTLPHLQ